MRWNLNDGGKPDSVLGQGDCVVRAIAIAGNLPYKDVADALRPRCKTYNDKGYKAASKSGVTIGINKRVYHEWLLANGWTWTPTMFIGQGCKVHLRKNELPSGRLIASLSKHLCAVVDGVIQDTYDPSREETRCVYGYYQPPTPEKN